MLQLKQNEWHRQWQMFSDNDLFLFLEWIYPNTFQDFQNKEVLECGCGCGQHTSFIAPYAKSVTAVDLNTIDIAAKRNMAFNNVEFVEADITSMDLGRKFDIVFSIGVIHHTDNPNKTVENLKKHLKPGGKLIIWVYSKEGNLLIRSFIEPIRKNFLKNLDRDKILAISRILTVLLYSVVYSLYLLPLDFLPYYKYFENFRKLSFDRNCLNVFDKLNAPQVFFINRNQALKWFDRFEFKNVHISRYCNVSWRCSGEKYV
jgi:SAM-dependent methyltransferase